MNFIDFVCTIKYRCFIKNEIACISTYETFLVDTYPSERVLDSSALYSFEYSSRIKHVYNAQYRLLLLFSTYMVRVVEFNATFNNISAILWRSVLLVEETGVHRENHRPVIDKLHHIMLYRVHRDSTRVVVFMQFFLKPRILVSMNLD